MKKLVLFLVLASARLFAQGGVYAGPTVVNGVGQPIANATVYIVIGDPCGTSPTYTFCNGQAQGIYTGPVPPSPLALTYTDITLGTTIANPIVTDPLGNWTVYTNPGVYWAVITGYQIVPTVQPIVVGNGQGGGGQVNCTTALNGSIAAFLSPTSLGCDPNMGTDFAGNGFSQSWKYLGPVNGFFGLIGGAPDPGTVPAYKLNANEVRALAPLTVPTPYYWRWPSTACAVGQVWQVTGSTTDANGDTVTTYGCLTPSNGVSITATSPIVVTPSPITGIGVISCPTCNSTSHPAMATPTAPTVTPTGVTGATAYSYKVVICQDGPNCTYRTAASSAGSTSTGNATLSSTNYNLLTAYVDSYSGQLGRCINVYRTAGGATQGLIGNCVWKQFKDTGLTGDGTTAPSTNTTTLDETGLTAPLPGCNKIWASPWGIDSLPCTNNAFNDEFTWGNGTWTLGDTNNPQWTWQNQETATNTLSNGAVIFTSGTTSGHVNMLSQPTPTAPYTFIAVVDTHATALGAGCNLGLRESATGKVSFLEIVNNLAADSASGSGVLLQLVHGTSASALSGVHFWNYEQRATYYIQIQVTGGNINYSYSLDGIAYQQVATEAQTVPFTTAPDQIFIGGRGNVTSAVCVFDYFRRTQ